jgi:hypothetical protein
MKKDLKEAVQERETIIEEIIMKEDQKRNLENYIVNELVRDNMIDLLTINWTRLNRYLGNIPNITKR